MTPEIVAWGFLLRFAQAFAEASPTLACGLITAGIFRQMMGHAATRQMFGGSGWRGLLRGWLWGMLLPVCSLGVIPVARELRRAGVGGGTILAFTLTAPLLNPISVLYGLTLSEPIVIVAFAAAAMAVIVAAGAIFERTYPEERAAREIADEPPPAPGLKRLTAALVTAARETTGPAIVFAGIGLAVSAAAAALIPYGRLQSTMMPFTPESPPLMAGIATASFAGPLPGMMKIGLMFEHGNSVAAAFLLLILGVGTSAGTLAWMASAFGTQKAAVGFGLFAGLAIATAYAIDRPLYFRLAEPEGHTHAFDDFSGPFAPDARPDLVTVWNKFAQRLDVLEPVALAGLAGLLSINGLVRLIERWFNVDEFLRQTSLRRSVLNAEVPGPVLAIAALTGLVVFSVAGAYIFYPDADQVFDDMARVRAEALSGLNEENREEKVRQVRRWDDLTRKLQVGLFLRTGRFDAEAGAKAEQLRGVLEKYRDLLLAKDVEAAKATFPEIFDAYRKFSEAYAGYRKAGPASAD